MSYPEREMMKVISLSCFYQRKPDWNEVSHCSTYPTGPAGRL
jgi:hypothetical protein